MLQQLITQLIEEVGLVAQFMLQRVSTSRSTGRYWLHYWSVQNRRLYGSRTGADCDSPAGDRPQDPSYLVQCIGELYCGRSVIRYVRVYACHDSAILLSICHAADRV